MLRDEFGQGLSGVISHGQRNWVLCDRTHVLFAPALLLACLPPKRAAQAIGSAQPMSSVQAVGTAQALGSAQATGSLYAVRSVQDAGAAGSAQAIGRRRPQHRRTPYYRRVRWHRRSPCACPTPTQAAPGQAPDERDSAPLHVAPPTPELGRSSAASSSKTSAALCAAASAGRTKLASRCTALSQVAPWDLPFLSQTRSPAVLVRPKVAALGASELSGRGSVLLDGTCGIAATDALDLQDPEQD